MVDKAIAQRDVEYFNELLSQETDENRRTILQRLLADAEERLRQAEEEGEKGLRESTATNDGVKAAAERFSAKSGRSRRQQGLVHSSAYSGAAADAQPIDNR